MSSGTFVKLGKYYNHFHFSSIEDILDEQKRVMQRIEQAWGEIIGLAMATPKDITPSDDTPEEYIHHRIADIRELLQEYDYTLQACIDIREGWETREED